MTADPKLPSSDIDILVVGAGFTGIYSLYALRNAGFTIKVFEAGSNLGGTWHWNAYPGARVDSDFFIYQLALEELWKDWNWTERFPGREELVQYFEYVDNKLDLSKDILYNTRVTDANFDTKLDRWIVSAENGLKARPRFIIFCTGFASKPYTPQYKGLETFKGIMHHTYFWPKTGVNTKDLRVGVIGTGATGVQVIQETAPVCRHLTVFQRTPNLALAMMQSKLDIESQEKLKTTYREIFDSRSSHFSGFQFNFSYDKFSDMPKEKRIAMLEELWQRGGLNYWLGGFAEMFVNDTTNAEVYEFWRGKILPRLKDPRVQAKLAPKIPPHPFGIKRHSLEQNYYEVFNQPNVTLVDVEETPIVEITQAGIRTKDGEEHELDVLVLATGFDAITGSISQINIRGTDGVLIGDKWRKKLSTYLGLTSANFPNMFFAYGPHGPTAFCNGPTCAELQSNWIIACVKYMRDQGRTRIEAELDAEKKWTDEVDAMFNKGMWTRAKSWYTGANIPGKNIESMNFTGGLPMYLKLIGECATNGYAGFTFFSAKDEGHELGVRANY